MKVGYARVSTTEQNLDRQLDALKKAGVQKFLPKKFRGRM
jgi:DNA invertase Pin-like site-specific DNA recombinase